MSGIREANRTRSGVAAEQEAASISAASATAVIAAGQDGLLHVLANPERFGFASGVWLAINAADDLVGSHASHTLAGRLGISSADLASMLDGALFGPGKGATSISRELNRRRDCGTHLLVTVKRTTQSDANRRTQWLAFGVLDLSTDPLTQLKAHTIAPAHNSDVLQPSPVHETMQAVVDHAERLRTDEAASAAADRVAADASLAEERRRSLRGIADPAEPTMPPAETMALHAELARLREENARLREENTRLHQAATSGEDQASSSGATTFLSLGAILQALGMRKPFRDADDRPITAGLLSWSFSTGLNEMAASSGARRMLVSAASVAVHAVLSRLAPDPIATAKAVVAPLRRNAQPDAMRLALTSASSNVPTGRPLLELLAASPLAQSLVISWAAAKVRGERVAVQAQILAPLTQQYTLRLFNECFESELAPIGGPLKRYTWWYARWHAHVWLAGQTPAQSSTQRWRLKGAGDANSLPHALIIAAVEFLTSDEYLQHVAFGTRHVKTSTGCVELSATERTREKEALWRVYEQSRAARLRVSRSHFLELADMVAGSTQKSYGALDTYAEQNGRQQALRIRSYCDEFERLMLQVSVTLEAWWHAHACTSGPCATHQGLSSLETCSGQPIVLWPRPDKG